MGVDRSVQLYDIRFQPWKLVCTCMCCKFRKSFPLQSFSVSANRIRVMLATVHCNRLRSPVGGEAKVVSKLMLFYKFLPWVWCIELVVGDTFTSTN